ITTGEGGMVVTDDARLAERAKSFRNLCFQPRQRFVHTELGYNFRLTNVQAAIGCAQIGRIGSFIERKRRMARAYSEALGALQVLQLPVEKEWAQNVYWMYGIVLQDDLEFDAAAFAQRLSKHG